MQVDFDKGSVEWSVDGVKRATAENERLRDRTIKRVPYILIYNKSVVAIVG